MYMCADLWDNDLVNRKEEQMKPIETTKQDVLGYMHTFIICHDTSTNKVFLAEVDLDFGCESFRGVFGPEAAAIDRIEMLMN
jgi:hypothetical protein